MNWIFDTYSNVYKTAMMQAENHDHHAASAKAAKNIKRHGLFGLFASR
ncbi:MAG: hypothetical protein ACKVP5_11600 [Aestuariivirga sp.]